MPQNPVAQTAVSGWDDWMTKPICSVLGGEGHMFCSQMD